MGQLAPIQAKPSIRSYLTNRSVFTLFDKAWFSYVADDRRFVVSNHSRRKFTKDFIHEYGYCRCHEPSHVLICHRQWLSPMSATYENMAWFNRLEQKVIYDVAKC